MAKKLLKIKLNVLDEKCAVDRVVFSLYKNMWTTPLGGPPKGKVLKRFEIVANEKKI